MTRPTPRARAGPDGARAREQLSTATAWGLDTAISLTLSMLVLTIGVSMPLQGSEIPSFSTQTLVGSGSLPAG